MSTVEKTVEKAVEKCECGGTLADGVCLNVNCTVAQEAATADASRLTAKVAVKGAKASSRTVTIERPAPRSFNISGRVD